MSTITTFGGGGGTSNNPDGAVVLQSVPGIAGPVGNPNDGFAGFFNELLTIGGRGVLNAAGGLVGSLSNGFNPQPAAVATPPAATGSSIDLKLFALIGGGVIVLAVAWRALFGGR